VSLEWPERRGDVLTALEVLAAEPPTLDYGGHDPRRPNVTDAVHWLVDDTSWDVMSPAESIGTMLRDEREVVLIQHVVVAVVAVSERQGATSGDAAWFADEAWSEVRSTARDAAAALRTP
jgi:hypothetical protein